MLQPQVVMWYIHSVLRRQPRRALRGIRALMRLRLYLDTSVISAYFEVLPVGEEDRAQAREYVRRGVFFPATLNNALHVAVAVVSRRDLLVSSNFRHLVNRRRRALVNEVSISLGYPTIEIIAPPEL